MSGVVYADDSQIAIERLEKKYIYDFDRERVVVHVVALADPASVAPRMAA